MKNIKRSKFCLPMAALILTAVFAVPAAAQPQGPCGAGFAPGCFKGNFQGQDAHDILPPGATTVVIRTTATGVGTHLARFSLNREITGNLLTFTRAGSAQWVAANGDSIVTTLVGHAELSDLPGGFWGSFTSIDVPGASSTGASGINSQGYIVGTYVVGGITHGFLARR